jgi:hypothetical protein
LESIASDLQFLRDLEDKSLSLLQKTEGAYDYEYVLIQINGIKTMALRTLKPMDTMIDQQIKF